MPFEEASRQLVVEINTLKEKQQEQDLKLEELRKQIDKDKGDMKKAFEKLERGQSETNNLLNKVVQNSNKVVQKNSELVSSHVDAQKIISRNASITQFVKNILVGAVCGVIGWFLSGVSI